MGLRTFIKDRIAWTTARLMHPGVLRDPRYFDLWQARGFHVTPVHFYQPVPDTRRLKGSLWTETTEAAGVDFREAEQLEMVRSLAEAFRHEYEALPKEPGAAVRHGFYLDNGGFRSVDAEVLYGMIRRFRPKRMIEIGSGLSTCLAAPNIPGPGCSARRDSGRSSTSCRPSSPSTRPSGSCWRRATCT